MVDKDKMAGLLEILRRKKTALFDLDGVVLDTESQYSQFWGGIGKRYFPEISSLDKLVKGRTLSEICRAYLDDKPFKEQVLAEHVLFQSGIVFNFVRGAEEFVQMVHERGMKTAIVTSSDQSKMEGVYKSHPHFKTWFDRILTEEDFKASKPDPDCYLCAAKSLQSAIEDCVVFEDSRNGLMSGRNAGMTVVGLATTLPRKEVEILADYTIDDFSDLLG